MRHPFVTPSACVLPLLVGHGLCHHRYRIVDYSLTAPREAAEKPWWDLTIRSSAVIVRYPLQDYTRPLIISGFPRCSGGYSHHHYLVILLEERKGVRLRYTTPSCARYAVGRWPSANFRLKKKTLFISRIPEGYQSLVVTVTIIPRLRMPFPPTATPPTPTPTPTPQERITQKISNTDRRIYYRRREQGKAEGDGMNKKNAQIRSGVPLSSTSLQIWHLSPCRVCPSGFAAKPEPS
ncbi:hypothetical protein QBC46DRAFT_139350 [Diplogelasinospora grovesii]|uniref:Uncharacterized protein n=1 Tax=Diplogelasinospora grovesii TaxID=303347 RepID=A0AAN6S480_9PEZI|nr:hypothetical protein QBC46DRAFT_139350 [Diplogelasinospora grovesii]